ncbi:MAG TPA: hypothetical protein DCR55_08825 [Lentisphaeria bacterium]|nr:hypothetical protein [Lentisphaeria bacterium]
MDFDRIPMQSWYPGHMRKAERQIDERLALVDVVLELRDARAPVSSENAVLGQLTGKRQRVILLQERPG